MKGTAYTRVFSKLNPACSMPESCLKKSDADFSISSARFSCWTLTYVKSIGIKKKWQIEIIQNIIK